MIKELYKAYKKMNKDLFNNELKEDAIISIASNHRQRSFIRGNFTPRKLWTYHEHEYHEIIIWGLAFNEDYK
ncbi:hypothetical protein [Williamsoniiplasma luminosum]|uniref:hypothetical protein n=1 Tax=Williamsoniiplasma luminosum TaxID=214888 RepID=UPI00046F2BD4|nr:hypothetical protein [Williamsoniiplasma luminosum]